MELTPAELELARVIGFEEHILLLVKGAMKRPLCQAWRWNSEGDQQPADGLSILAPKDEILVAIGNLRTLLGSGYHAYVSKAYLGNGAFKSDEMVVLRASDQYEILRLRQTNGGNYDVSLEDVLSHLKDWERLCEFEIVGATGDSITIQFHTLPQDLLAFAEEVYRLCPDSVEQGVGLMQERQFPDRFAAARQLYPKLSPEMQRKLAEDAKRAEATMAKAPPELRRMIESSGFNTSTEMGIRLLAYEIKTMKSLFLWWD
jgi:hypothetical protein